jgi:peptide/nickel transport system permease protein
MDELSMQIKEKMFWQRYKKNRFAVISFILLILFIGASALTPIIAPNDPLIIGPENLAPPSWKYIMGTDELGRDVFHIVLYGIRTSLLIGILAALSCVSIGILIGALSGFFGGHVDNILMRLTDYFLIIPKVFLAILLCALFGPTMWNVILVVAIVSWPSTARLVRAPFLKLKESDFVTAAKALGASNFKIIFREILPNVMPIIIVNGALEIAYAITLEAGLSFLGLGDPSIPSLGYMLFKAQRFLRSAWWMSVFPGVAIFGIVISINFIGDGLNDALNPRLRERYA